ncbi:RHS repeat-associated protein [Chryseobacterium sp. 7]|uniref:hypothetical protein n=1 Tax=Chryseobacterium sp. 7 TaxID=2035214 RepID=UPI000EB0B4ED|nr:hypothetical protein [Chryseobacterium sp. 7]RLJ30848.1 RHS repeat-associated protein [Chryseobacterium sp. 7]
MRKCLLIIFAILAGFLQAQTKKQTSTTRQKTEKKWVNPVKLTKEERSRPYMDEVLKTRDSLTPKEAERRRKNIAIGNPFAKYGYYPKIATLSKGKYLEFHDMDSIVKIGSVRFNRKTRAITEFREIDLSDPDAQPYLDTAGRWISPDPLSEEFPSWSPYHIVYNNPISNIDPDGRAAFDWVHNRETNSVYWNPNATSQSTAGANETYLGKSGTYTAADGSTTALGPGGPNDYTNNSLLGGLGVVPNLDPLIHAGDSAPGLSIAMFGDSNASTISSIPDSRGKTQLQSLVAENPLVQDAVVGAVTGGALNAIIRRATLATEATEKLHGLYEGVNAAGEVKYVGRTSQPFATRFAQHAAEGGEKGNLFFRQIKGASGMTLQQARVAEQNLINQYGLQKNGGQLINKINSIAPKYWSSFGVATP